MCRSGLGQLRLRRRRHRSESRRCIRRCLGELGGDPARPVLSSHDVVADSVREGGGAPGNCNGAEMKFRASQSAHRHMRRRWLRQPGAHRPNVSPACFKCGAQEFVAKKQQRKFGTCPFCIVNPGKFKTP